MIIINNNNNKNGDDNNNHNNRNIKFSSTERDHFLSFPTKKGTESNERKGQDFYSFIDI